MLPEIQIERLYSALGSRIREQRQVAGFNQSKFAKLIRISRSSLVNIENGRQRAPLHLIYSIAQTLNLSIEILLPSQMGNIEEMSEETLRKDISAMSAGDSKLKSKLEQFVAKAKSSYE